jgi:hypothetical protein
MLDFTPAIPDSTLEAIAATAAVRTIAAAAVSAGMLANDRERFGDVARRGANDIPAIPLLLRSTDAPLHSDYVHELVDLTASFIASLAPKSPAAELITRYAACVSLAGWQGGAHIVGGKVALWPCELSFTATLTRHAVERCDIRSAALLLVENAAVQLDRSMFSSISATPGVSAGLMSRIAPVLPSNAGAMMDQDLSRLGATAGTFLVAGPKQAEQIKRGFTYHRVRASEALTGTVVAIGENAVLLAGIGPCRVEAKMRPSRERVELRFCARLAWALREPDVMWARVNW